MCGRFTSTTPAADLAAHFGAELFGVDTGPRWNVAPTSEIWIVRAGDHGRVMEPMRWGLVPSWADDPSFGSRMINARAETVADKPSFRRAYRARRCVVPADGFYEWATVPGQRQKQPWYFHDPSHLPLALAGLWETWRPQGAPEEARATETLLHTCTILTTSADDVVAPVHQRMPVMFDADQLAAWLDPSLTDPRELDGLVSSCQRNQLQAHRVTTAVNSVANDGDHLLTEAAT
jgi:putative SOS response-associated peptidase YedK